MPEPLARTTEPAFVQRFRNLTGLPSYHYDAVFGRIVHELFALARPAVVALELPASFRPALEWAASCWPTPVAALERGREATMGMILPFVPGDSIFEAFRLASQAGIEVALVDTDVSVAGEQRPERTLAIGPEFASRPGDGFFAAVDALNNREAPLVSDLAREAAMAAALAALMAQHESVWWVGGFAHWSRIVERLQSNNFSGPEPEAYAATSLRARPPRIVRPVAPNGLLPGHPGGVRAEPEAVRAIRRHADSPARGRDSRARC